MNMKSISKFTALVLIGLVLSCVQSGFGQNTTSKSNQTQQKSTNKQDAAKEESGFDRLLKELKKKKELVLIGRCLNEPCKSDKVQAIDGRVIKGKVVEGRILSKPPTPKNSDYPPPARAVEASGAVVVQMLFDEPGNVIAAQVVSGHPLLRETCLKSARWIRLAPTMVDGKPVKIIGTYTYNVDLRLRRSGM